MKRLVLFRHSKTETTNPAGDKARELTKRGHRFSEEMGRAIKRDAGKPDLFVTSDAIRSIQTADLAEEAMEFHGKRVIEPAVYGATVDELWQVVHELPDDANAIVLVGHNPGLEDLAGQFEQKSPASHLPTSGYVVMDLKIDHWKDAAASNATIVAIGAPDKN